MTEEIMGKLEGLNRRFLVLKSRAGFQEKENVISSIEERMKREDFWADRKSAQESGKKLSLLRREISPLAELGRELEDAGILCSLVQEENDPAVERELEASAADIESRLSALELRAYLGGEFDMHNAIIELHSGAGGTESCDWAEMLLRMYSKWAQKKEFDWKIISVLPGDEAGIKSVTVLVSGDYAYGRLKSESGVHRLVRISPFDSQSRRHTSFCSVYVIPEVDKAPDFEIKSSELRVETFRASGHGGQHVNTTDSAVRITHVPTGITAQCQNERSQHQNKERAMNVLYSRLYSHYQQEKEKEFMEKQGQKQEIGWGSQIRSYVFHPYSMIKDHRTGAEKGNVQAVMDGEIDEFIDAFLKKNRGADINAG